MTDDIDRACPTHWLLEIGDWILEIGEVTVLPRARADIDRFLADSTVERYRPPYATPRETQVAR